MPARRIREFDDAARDLNLTAEIRTSEWARESQSRIGAHSSMFVVEDLGVVGDEEQVESRVSPGADCQTTCEGDRATSGFRRERVDAYGVIDHPHSARHVFQHHARRREPNGSLIENQPTRDRWTVEGPAHSDLTARPPVHVGDNPRKGRD